MARWRLKSPASRLFTQPFIQTQIKENIKAPRHWPLCGEFTGPVTPKMSPFDDVIMEIQLVICIYQLTGFWEMWKYFCVWLKFVLRIDTLSTFREINDLVPCHIMNLLWSLSDKGTRVRFCWVPSHCGIDGNERVDQLAKKTLDQDIDPLASVHYTDMKPLVNSYIQKLVQTEWDVAVHGRDLYLVKPTLGPPKKFQHLTRAEEVVITRLWIDHWPYAAGVCIVTGMSWILHSRLVECSLRDNSWDLLSRIPARSGILLSDMM